MTGPNTRIATSASKSYFDHANFAANRHDDFEVTIDGQKFPVGGAVDEVSDCFHWTDQTDDGLARTGLPKSEDKAREAAELVFAHLDKTDWEPRL
jgi:hypothetical protein